MKIPTSFTKLSAIAALVIILSTVNAVAATFTVINTNDSGAGSLRQAILDANATVDADTITFDPSVFSTPQTIVLAGTVLAADGNFHNLTITGPGANLLTVSGNNVSRVFSVGGGGVVSISGMTVTRGNSLTGLFPGFGGGIVNGGALTLTNVVVTNNSATRDGGGISNLSESNPITLINCVVSNNVANTSGGSTGRGGGIFGSILTVTDSTISGNSIAPGTIGAKLGGGIFLLNGSLTMSGSTVSGNSAASSDGAGGGIYLLAAPGDISNSTISDNSAGGGAGGIYMSAVTTITNSTISGNSTGLDGGGIFEAGSGSKTLTNVTVVNNMASRDGGGIYKSAPETSSSFFVGNTIIANNTDNGTAPDIANSVVSQGYNLIGDTTGATITGDTATNVTGVDPNLGPLQDNGGPTETHALLAGSPAIDQGDSSGATTDQRGFIRPIDDPDVADAAGGDGSDIGAFESSSTPAFVPGPLQNISTRLQVLSGDQVLIGGFIITGSDPKTVILRAIGPSLEAFGISGPLADPVLELRAGDGSLIMTNDNWQTDQQDAITATGLAPTDDLESAIIATLNPGNYTAIVSGSNGGTGVGLVEAYDLDQTAASELANISTRGFVDTGNNVMIGGFILGSDTNVLVRAIGPTLSDFGVTGALADPTLELRDGQGTLVSSNDNWMDSAQKAEIEGTGLAPQKDAESAVLETLPTGAYTAIVSGQGGTAGVGLVEVYRLP